MTPARSASDNLFAGEKHRVWLSIGKLELPARLATQQGVETLTHLLDEHLERDPSTVADRFLAAAKKPLVACGAEWKQDEETIRKLYERLYELHAEGRNGMWARIIKNAFAPVFLAPFDYVAGNPPWINWQNLPEGYRSETKDLWSQHGLFVHKGMDTILGKGKKDISTLVTYVAADSYLKTSGRLGFVITQSVFKTSGAGQGFRRFLTKSKVPLNCHFVDDFSEMQLFEGATNRTAVFILRKGQPTKYPVQYVYWRKREGGRSGSFGYDATLEEVIEKTERKNFVASPVNPKDKTSAWLAGPAKAVEAVQKLLGKSDYKAHEGVNTGGANAVYWFEILHDHGDGTVTARNITEGAKRKIDSVQVRLEKELLYPLLRGRDVSRWKAKPRAWLLFVQDPAARHGIDEGTLKRKCPLTYDWLSLQKETLLARASQSVRNLMKNHSFYSMFGVGDYTMAMWKAVWSEQSSELQCAVAGSVDGKVILPDHKAMFIDCPQQTEAHHLTGLMNSTLFRFAVSSYAIEIQMGPHLIANLRIPKFNPDAALHQQIVTEAKRLSSGATDAGDPIHPKLDQLCAQLWGVDAKGLKAVQEAYLELHAKPKKAKKAEEAEEE